MVRDGYPGSAGERIQVNMKVLRASDIIGDRGVALIHSFVSEMGSLWHPTGLEAGIDGLIEFRDPTTGEMLNQHLAVQSKATGAPFPAGNPSFTCREKDLEYWLKGNMPVILIYSHPPSREAFWVSIRDYFASPARRRSRKILFDRARDRFDAGALHRLLEIAVEDRSGLYLAPPPTPEVLYANLQRVTRLPERLYHCYTGCARPKEIRERLNESGGRELHEWAYRGKQILSVHDLSGTAWRGICDAGTVEAFDTVDWAESSDDRRDDFVDLMNQCLRTKLTAMHVRFDSEERYFHYTATRDLKPRVVRYRSLRQDAEREVFKLYQRKNGDRVFEYYRHSAFRGRFRKYDQEWFLQIDPTYRFTTDGRSVHPNSSKLLTGIRKLERNQAVLGQVAMWASLLQDSDSQDLFATKPYAHVGFGDLLTFESPVGIHDEAWTGSPAESPSGESHSNEILEIPFDEVEVE